MNISYNFLNLNMRFSAPFDDGSPYQEGLRCSKNCVLMQNIYKLFIIYKFIISIYIALIFNVY